MVFSVRRPLSDPFGRHYDISASTLAGKAAAGPVVR
jgi:hypothetical protein